MKRSFCFMLAAFFIFAIMCGCADGNVKPVNNRPAETQTVIKPGSDVKVVDSKPLLVACMVNQDDQYMRLLQLGMSDAAEKAGVQVILANTNGKLDKEIELINTYIKSGVDGLCIHPVSVDLSLPILKKAKDAGVKVISAGISIDEQYQIGYIESNQWELGEKTGAACRRFIETNLGGKANIAVLNYTSQFSQESNQRTDGFESQISDLPDVKIVTKQEAWLAENAVKKAGEILDSQPGLNIIWAANEGGTVGAAIAVKNAGMAGKVYVFGTDVNEQLLNMLLDKDNILQAVTGQQPYEIGYQSMDELIKNIQGEHTEGQIIIHGVPLSRNNQKDVKDYIEVFKKMIAPAN